MIDWTKATIDEVLAVNAIAKRAAKELPDTTVIDTQMNLEACHTHGCPLDLVGLLAAGPADFAHDVCGIARHLDRDTGQLLDCFTPRFAKATGN